MKPNFEENNDYIWVFLSHSNKDYETVRNLRNMMEERGMRPLMFLLKCLDSEPEIFELLKREIDARPRFILCDSTNARESEWVQKEVEYIKSKSRQYITVDLNCPETFVRKIEELKSRSQVFLSYSNNDAYIAEELGKQLQSKGFAVFNAKYDLVPGYSYDESIENAISHACKNGYFIPIISENYLKSRWCIGEFDKAVKLNAYVVPCMVNEPYVFSEIPGHVFHQGIISTDSSFKTSIKEFCDGLVKRDLVRNV